MAMHTCDLSMVVEEAHTLRGGQDGKTESKANLGYTQLRTDCKTLSL